MSEAIASRCCVAGRLSVVIGYWSPWANAFSLQVAQRRKMYYHLTK